MKRWREPLKLLGVLARRSHHLLLDYLMWVLAVLVGIGIVALARRYL